MTPLCDVLKHYAARNPARFHMPGHKGGPLPLPELSGAARLDVTEIPGTGNLYLAGEPFDSAQKPWAERFGFDHCQFLTGGSTMGIHTGLSLLCAPGEQVLVDRNCHRAVFNAMALLDLEPVYLERPWLEQENLIGPITPEQVEFSLKTHPNVKTICITSPTYAGVLSDIGAISPVVHAHGARLFVDGAHGAHLPFLGLTPFAGADGLVVSAHKTLPALGQAALLFTNGMDSDRVRRMASVFGTSSPSYPILASMDAARAWLEGDGARAYRQTALRGPGLPADRPPGGPAAAEVPLPGRGPVPGPRPAHSERPGRSLLRPVPGGAEYFSRDGGRGPRGVYLHPSGPGGELRPPGAGPGGHGGPDGPLSSLSSPPLPSPAGAGLLPAGGPLCPHPAGPPVPQRRAGLGGPDRALSPRRARGGPRGADFRKRTGLFPEDRV